MEKIDVETLANNLLSGKVDNKTYNQVIEKVEINQDIIKNNDVNATTNFFIIGGFMSILGLSYFVYGKKSKKLIPYVAGLGMSLIPYFVHDFKYLLWIALGLIILPFVIKV